MYYKKTTESNTKDAAKQKATEKEKIRQDMIKKLGLSPETIKNLSERSKNKPKIIKNEIGSGKKRTFP